MASRTLRKRALAPRREMEWRPRWYLCFLGLTVALAPGCQQIHYRPRGGMADHAAHYQQVAADLPLPDLAREHCGDRPPALPPRTVAEQGNIQYWNLTLEEALRIALTNTTVLRDLQGRVITTPQNALTVYDPAIRKTNGQFGEEAALSAFDAQWQTQLAFSKTDRPLNTPDFLGNNILFQQDGAQFSTGLSKVTGVGGQLFLQNVTNYDANNALGQRFPSSYQTATELGFRQPLLQGFGVDVNRIAGPNATPGFFFANGVALARLNTDVTLHDFEAGVIQFVSDVEDAYWELAFAYRDLDAKRAARDAALATWQRVKALYEVSKQGGEAQTLARAGEQLHFFEVELINALHGAVPQGGVYGGERRLRRLLGLSANDGYLIRPVDEPARARLVFDWPHIVQEAVALRVELRRQRVQVRIAELQLVAAKNFLLPRLDIVGVYRFFGLGDDLMGRGPAASAPFGSAFQTMFDGNFQESSIGLEYTVPLGFRRASANLRNSQLQLIRQQDILNDQELQVETELYAAVSEVDRAYAVAVTSLMRLEEARRNLEAVESLYFAVQKITFDEVVDAQRLVAAAESSFYRAAFDYMRAIKQVHVAKGTLLEYDGVYLAEGPHPKVAYSQAEKLRRFPRQINYVLPSVPTAVGRGNIHRGTPLAMGDLPVLSPIEEPSVGPGARRRAPEKDAPPSQATVFPLPRVEDPLANAPTGGALPHPPPLFAAPR